MTNAGQFHWTSAALTHVGRVRDLNEDACLEQPEHGLWAVADGMGGHARGDVASRTVVDALRQVSPGTGLANLVIDVRDRLLAANRDLRLEAAVRDVDVIGSTVVVLVAGGNACTCVWAGDSRIYLCRNSRLKRLTRDHSQIEELKARGDLSAEEIARYPGHNLITRAIGATDYLDLEEKTLKVCDGDVFLLCSDGLSNEVGEPEMRRALMRGDCRQAAEALIDMALQHGGRDNISVVVVHAEDPDASDQTVLNPAL